MDNAKLGSGLGMSETWPIGLDNLEGPFHLPGKFGGLFLLCQPASLSSPHALSWGSFRKSCHDYSADKRICAVLPSPAGGGEALGVGVSGWA